MHLNKVDSLLIPNLDLTEKCEKAVSKQDKF